MTDGLTYDVIIIGGGLAGLSAAVELSSSGRRILLLEQHQYLGGRTHSFIDEKTGDTVDNGQHLMMGCYRETRRYLHTIGAEHLASLQKSLRIDFLDPIKGFSSFLCGRMPSPFHVLFGMLKLSSLSIADRLRLLRVGWELRSTTESKDRRLEAITVDEWLTSLHQSNENKNYLWDTIAIGSLNDSPQKVSALMFFRVLRAAFTGSRENCSLLIPNVGLSSLLVDPAVQFIKQNGGDVRTNSRVDKFFYTGQRLRSIHLVKGKILHAQKFILAIPYFDLPLITSSLPPAQDLSSFSSAPIISINLWFDREVMTQQFVAVLNSRIQWIFNRSVLCRTGSSQNHARQHLSLVISGAERYVNFDKEQIVHLALEDLLRVLPSIKDARLVHSLVLKEKRATFSPRPGIEALRPGTKTNIENLFLAGDWTNSGLPSTIEGAIMSGRKAAEAVLFA